MQTIEHETGFVAGADRRTWVPMLGLSVVLHVFVLAGAVFLPQLAGSHEPRIPVTDVEWVDLVQTAPAGDLQKADPPKKVEAPKPPEPKTQEPDKQPEPVADKTPLAAEKTSTEPEPSAAEPPEVKLALKKQTLDPKELKNAAIERLAEEAKVEKDRPNPVADAIDKIRKMLENQDKQAVSSRGVKDGTADSSRKWDIMDLYKLELRSHVNRHWAYPQRLVGADQGLSARIMITITKNGRITDMWFEKKSGNNYFDDSAERAVKKSDPAPPLPLAYNRGRFTVGLEFTPPVGGAGVGHF